MATKDNNGDGSFRVDHLGRTGTGSETWQRPSGPDDIIEQQIVPVTVSGAWDFSRRKPCYILSNAPEIEDMFCHSNMLIKEGKIGNFHPKIALYHYSIVCGSSCMYRQVA